MTTLVRRIVGCVMGAAMALNAACYSFVAPTSAVVPKVGGQIRVKLNATGTSELAQFLGPRVEYADGTLSEMRADGSVVVGVSSVRLLDGLENVWSGVNVVTFAPAQVAEVQVRTLDKGRTRTAWIVGVVGLIGIFAALGVGGASGSPGVGGGEPPP